MRLKEYCINEKQTIKEAVSIIQNNHSRCAVVVNDDNKVIGVFSEGDVLRSILGNIEQHAPLKRVISPSFKYLNEKDMLKAYELVKTHGITLVPIIDKDFVLKDVITIYDVMDHLAFKDEQ